jgi:large subunit ribosomal protein L4
MSETETLQAQAFTSLGTARDTVALPASPFDGTVNLPVMHQAVTAFLANQRQATAYTKTRKQVVGGNQKPWKQKGTGRARQGSTRAPNWPGGGTVFGPHGDRNYGQKVPRQVRALARKSALNARARSGDIVLVDRFAYEKPKTALLLAALERIGVADRKVLILTDGAKPAVYLSARNLPNVDVLPYADVSTYNILWSDVVVIEASALGQELAPLAEKAAELRPTRKSAARAKAAVDAPDAEVAEEGAAPRGKRKTVKAAAKAPAAKRSPARKAAAKRSTKSAAKPAAKRAKPAAKTAATKTTRKKGK